MNRRSTFLMVWLAALVTFDLFGVMARLRCGDER
jgi:hypothetical protein